MTRIIAIGECMVEMAPSESQGEYRMGFAGDTMNTAWYLRKLLPPSDHVDYLTAVGSDATSAKMTGFLEEAGIGTGQIARRDGLTVGLYMISLADGERSFSYWRGQSAARTLAQDAAALDAALDGADVAYFSGITLAILPDDDRARLLEALSKFRAKGGDVVFDPNLRPGLWPSSEAMTDAVMQAAAVSSTVLPSHEDEATWFGDADTAATAQRYVSCGAQTVIVKNGPDEMLAWDAGTTSTHAPVAAVKVVDTTAAGDSFNAGFLASRIAGQPLDVSINAAANLAARVIQARGALADVT
ncbi:sugar kinase [Litoreibacter janthinus]|uniref:2-dehydro-3-deoxygluconokinase n=1 Tax=Litoreibacter janthinus TaxID=670154 RepID=A0A1I6GWI5_9RHOB|nr:sugar kinase [Litoreibacter janthinus]SFR46614.1 2-dehydro-3-deoxygluconokinase [Litoreibacter janthinus]